MTWKERRVAEMADLVNGFPFASSSFRSDEGMPLVRVRDILSEPFETFVPPETVPVSAVIRNGDVVIGMDGDFNVVHWARGAAALNQRLCLLRENGSSDMRFLAYALPTHLRVINDLTYATTVKHLSSGQVRAIRLQAPVKDEQKVIADFLDRETARIDALIEEQQRLIEMLRERRQAVIDHEIRDGAGVPLISLRGLVLEPIAAGADETSDPSNPAGWPRFVRTTDIMSLTQLDPDKRVTADPGATGDAMLARNDLVATRAGTIGKAYIHLSDEPASYAGYLVRIRPDPTRVVPMFLGYWSQSRHYTDQIAVGAVKSTIENFSASKYRATRVPVPPLNEQQRVVSRLDERIAKIDKLIAETEHFIELSRERRAALITAAVTGQIDVREVV